jgi:hypothetical protein
MNIGDSLYAARDWWTFEFWRFVFVQQEVAKRGQTAVDFPPMQPGASFNLEAVKEQSRRQSPAGLASSGLAEAVRASQRWGALSANGCVYRSALARLPALKAVLLALSVRERAIQRVEILKLSAAKKRSLPCNLEESPCIYPMCRERRVGLGLAAQPPSRGPLGCLFHHFAAQAIASSTARE